MCTSNSCRKSTPTARWHPPTQRKATRSTRYLFTAALDSIYSNDWLGKPARGLKIEGEYLSRLRFADDILICANTPHELQQIIQELADESENQGLKMNKSKTKVMKENDTRYVNNIQIENVDSYIYLPGKRYSIRDKNQDKEIQRRITAEEQWSRGRAPDCQSRGRWFNPTYHRFET